jgi:tagatose 6-phosphate kinase
VILCVCPSPALDVTYRVAGLAVGATNRVQTVTVRPGGKGVNVARVLTALGTDARVLAPTGGPAGAEFAARLAALGVAAELIPSGSPTRRTITVVGDDGAHPTMFTEPAELDCWAELARRGAELIAEAVAVVISGVVPAGAPADALHRLVALAHGAGVPVLVDTSGPPLVDALAARPTLIKPNAVELAQATGDDDPVRAARALARRYGTTVVASLGAAGVLAATAERTWRATPARALTGNPTGAGDALVAALARGLAAARPLPELLADAVALAAAAVLSPHAGDLDLADYAAQRDGVQVRELDAVR